MTRCPFSLLAALAVGCGGSQEPTRELPAGCAVEPEHVRVQLCPRHAEAVVCSDTGQTNFDPARCDGPDWTDGRQVTGNAWCCDERPTRTCDPLWAHCVRSGLTVECVSNGAEALCTCQGTLEGRLVALACYQ